MITASGRISEEVDRRITNASKAFGALNKAVFKDNNLTLDTKDWYIRCMCYQYCYMAQNVDTITKLKDQKKLNAFHHWCIRIILNITNWQQLGE